MSPGTAAGPGSGPKVLVTAASKAGATAEIARALAAELAGSGMRVTVRAPGEVASVAG